MGAFARRGQKLMGLVVFSLFFLSAEKNTDYIFSLQPAPWPPSFFLQHLPFPLRSLLLSIPGSRLKSLVKCFLLSVDYPSRDSGMEGSAFFFGNSTTYRGWFQMSELDFVYRYSVCVIGLLKLRAKRVDLGMYLASLAE